jgi:hypothetical protein
VLQVSTSFIKPSTGQPYSIHEHVSANDAVKTRSPPVDVGCTRWKCTQTLLSSNTHWSRPHLPEKQTSVVSVLLHMKETNCLIFLSMACLGPTVQVTRLILEDQGLHRSPRRQVWTPWVTPSSGSRALCCSCPFWLCPQPTFETSDRDLLASASVQLWGRSSLTENPQNQKQKKWK